MAEEHSLSTVLADVMVWRRETFPQSTASSTMVHLQRELNELAHDPSNAEEIADMVVLLFGLADVQGIDLTAAIAAKLAVNKARQWGEPDASGVVEHRRESSGG